MDERVAQVRRARLDAARLGVRVGKVDEVALAGRVIADGHDRERTRNRLLDADEPGWVVLDEDEVVVGVAEPVTIDLASPVVLVDADVIEAERIAHPDDRPVGIDHAILEIEAGREIAHTDDMQFRAGGIRTPGELAMVGRDFGIADLEEGELTALRVAVQHDLLVGRCGAAPTEQRLLPTLAVALVVQPASVRKRHGRIVLLHAAAHFRHERRRQRLQRTEMRLGVGVLGLQDGTDRRGKAGGITQDVTPSVGPQPSIVIRQGDIVQDTAGRVRRNRRRRQGRPGVVVRIRCVGQLAT